MKKVVLLFAVAVMALMSGSKVSAQGKYGPDSTECIKYLSYYTEYYKQKNYESALPNWRKAYHYCPPSARYSMLSDGSTLIRNLIQKNKNNPVYKAQLVDSLMTLYDQRVQYFPKYAISSLNNKALDMSNYMKDEPMKLLEGLTEIIEQTKEQTRTNVFVFQLNTAIDLYKIGMVDPETVIDIYDKGVMYLGQVKPKNDVEQRSIAKTIEDFETLFISSQVASCENLITLFTPRLEADPQNLDLAKNVVKIMSITEGCTDNDVYLNAVNTMYALEPSANSAYYLYRLYSGRNDYDNAVKYLEEAINSEETDAVADGGYYYELAVYALKCRKTAKAYASAQKAMELNPELAGKSYMIMGTIWGSTVCDGNEIERRAPYWVAVDYMVKAKNADAALAEDANNYIKQYSAYFPQTAEAFMYDIIDGQSYTVSCGGMRATTTVRTQK
jgi:tetratricopeptide (TPR) repeat protein